MRNEHIKSIFATLDGSVIEQVGHFDYEGDEWYLVVPRYKEYVNIVNLETNEKHTIYHGEAFTIKCNLSDLYSNIEISTDIHGGHKFSPQLGGEGRVVISDDVWDITDYTVTQ